MAKRKNTICSFCGKSQHEVKKMIAGPCEVFICDSCTRVCKTIIDRELGKSEDSEPEAAPAPAPQSKDFEFWEKDIAKKFDLTARDLCRKMTIAGLEAMQRQKTITLPLQFQVISQSSSSPKQAGKKSSITKLVDPLIARFRFGSNSLLDMIKHAGFAALKSEDTITLPLNFKIVKRGNATGGGATEKKVPDSNLDKT